MPVYGRTPKPDGQKRNRVKPTYEWTEVVKVPYTGDVPVEPNPDWSARTMKWWDVLIHMPHCVLWEESDWQMARDTADLAARLHKGDMRIAAELRQRERLLGTTHDARRDIRVRYVEAAVDVNDGEGTVSTMADYQVSIGA